MSTHEKTKPAAEPTGAGTVELAEAQLDGAAGGLIGLLLPAVQKVREAAVVESVGTKYTT